MKSVLRVIRGVRSLTILVILLAVGVLGAVVAAQAQQINGAGASFPYPIYAKWFSEYNKLNPKVQINYQSIGSGGGIRQLTAQTVFFGATDGPMTKEQLLATPGNVLHFPTVLGAVVPDPSDRCITVMSSPGRFTPALSLVIAGSFHFVILPRKISARTVPLNLSSVLTPSTLYTGTTAPRTVGKCSTLPGVARSCSFVIGPSVAPKNTVCAASCRMPPPDPIDW